MNVATVVPKSKTSEYTELQISNLQINANTHLYIRASIRTKTTKLWENDS